MLFSVVDHLITHFLVQLTSLTVEFQLFTGYIVWGCILIRPR